MRLSNKRAVQALRNALHGDGNARISVSSGPARDHDTLLVTYGTSTSLLTPVWAGEGFPKDVTDSLDSLDSTHIAKDETVVIVARTLSTGAQALLDDRGISWADETGGAAISAAPGLIVRRDSARTPPRPPRDGVAWTPGAGTIAEHLLDLATRGDTLSERVQVPLPTVAQLAADTNLSRAFVSRTLTAFDSKNWTTKRGTQRGTGARRDLTDGTGMLSGWAAWHARSQAATIHTHATYRDPEVFLRDRIERAWQGSLWALTGWLALERRAPLMTTMPVITVYIDPDVFDDRGELDSRLTQAGLRKVDTGARVDLLRADPALIRPAATRSLADTHQVSDVRLYGDLLRLGPRGADAAEHLRTARIGL